MPLIIRNSLWRTKSTLPDVPLNTTHLWNVPIRIALLDAIGTLEYRTNGDKLLLASMFIGDVIDALDNDHDYFYVDSSEEEVANTFVQENTLNGSYMNMVVRISCTLQNLIDLAKRDDQIVSIPNLSLITLVK